MKFDLDLLLRAAIMAFILISTFCLRYAGRPRKKLKTSIFKRGEAQLTAWKQAQANKGWRFE